APSPLASAAWSPGGARLALPSEGGVAVVNADGTDLHSVYAGLPSLDPSWSYDSKTIAFETKGPYRHIALAASDGSGETPLEGTHAAWNDRFPVWAPFTSHLAFVSNRGGTSS